MSIKPEQSNISNLTIRGNRFVPESEQNGPLYFELVPTILIRASTIDDADRLLRGLLDNAGDDVRCFSWTTIEAGADAAAVFSETPNNGVESVPSGDETL